MITACVRWVLRHPQTVAAAWLFLALASAAGLARIRVDFSSASFYGHGAAELRELADYTQRWGPDDRSLAVVVRTPGDVLDDDALAQLAKLEAAVAAAEVVTRTRSIASIVVPGYDQPLEAVWPALEGAGRAAVRAALDHSPAVPLLLAANHRSAVVAVELDRSTDDLGEAITAVQAVRAALEDVRPPEWNVELAGVPAVRAAFFALTIRDQAVLGPLALLVAIAGLLVATRRAPVAAVAAVGAGTPPLLLGGCLGATGTPVGLLTQALFTLLPIIAVADTVHVVTRVRAVAAQEGRTATDPAVIVAAMRDVGWACLLTSATTSVGFGSMMFASLPLLRAFGLWAALGTGLAYGVMLTLVPIVLLRLDVGSGAPQGSPRLRSIAWGCARRPGRVFAATALLVVVSVPAAQRVVVDNHLGALLRPDHPVRQAGAHLDRVLGGTLSLEVELEVDDPGSANGASLDAVAGVLREIPEARGVVGPDRRGTHARFSLRVADIGGLAFADVERRVDARLAQAGRSATTTGTASVAYRGVNRVTTELRTSLIIVLGVVVLAVGVGFGSAGLAARSVLPNALPLGFGYAVVGATGLELDPIGAVILTVALGIAVDDTLHILAGYRAGLHQGLAPDEAVAAAVATRGHAIVITSLVLVAGLSINLLSAFPPLAVLGSLGALVIGFAMVADLTLLPALLAWRWRPSAAPGSRRESGHPATAPR